ncbi:class I SAM-dependent methyltransferase [Algoriphagus confluentis]|uniref:Class I SAM-dependent methyltransferase n=1 Tax=Algoriphagus confluentis TaxID=1697556 RepID=A0ABQ6PRL7_9BACT|nr:class I SAM-dependent methyltransferase [Algoriphagus confluentis]
MDSGIFSFLAYLRYWLRKEDQYSQQSPFLFKIYQGLVDYLSKNPLGTPSIEQLRSTFLTNSNPIQVLDLGAGSKRVSSPFREIRKITKYSTSSPKFCLTYQYFCGLTPSQTVIELGTCMGLSTRYLSDATRGRLFTFEGAPEILEAAQSLPFSHHVEAILGPIEANLPLLLDQLDQVDFALIDANHTYSGTTAFFNWLLPKFLPSSICIIGDIHWSPEMEAAWDEIIAHPQVKLSLDFFECGVLFFDYSGEKTNRVLAI